MKKIILAAAALLMTTGAFAQLDWGIKGGLNLANLTDNGDSKFKPSLYIGAFAEFEINEFFSVQPELMYSRQGYFAKDGGNKLWWRMNYLNLPVIAKLYVLEGLSIDLGPQFGYLLNAKAKVKQGGTTTTGKVKDTCKDFDVSFVLGASYKITDQFDISARYLLGLTKTNDINLPGDDTKCKNSVIQIGVGYRF